MKTVCCPNCETKFDIPEDKKLLECVVCGKIWTEKKTRLNKAKKSNIKPKIICILLFILIVLSIYAFVIKSRVSDNLYITLSELTAVPQFDGSFKLNVSGTIANPTNNTMPIPTINIKLFSAENEVIDQSAMIPPSPLIDSKQNIEFKYLITPPNDSVARAEVFFNEAEK